VRVESRQILGNADFNGFLLGTGHGLFTSSTDRVVLKGRNPMHTVSHACSRRNARPNCWRAGHSLVVNATIIVAVLGSMAVVAVDLSAQSASSPKNVRLIAGSPVLNSLSISGPTSVTVGQTAQYMVQATDASGGTVGVGAVWSTSNSGLATITQSGVLTAVATGTVTVQATF